MKNEKPSIFAPETAPLDVTFLVLPGASILCVASSIDPLRAANRIAGEALYRWTIVSPDGAPPETTSGLPVAVTGKFDANARHEVLIVIACVGCITLFIAATIAITATDIKRVLAYSTVSQLGYMMLALGVGGWVAGLFHLFTHAFFKALLFLLSLIHI